MNKKNIFALILLALMLLVSSCNGNNDNPNTKTPEKCETHIDLNNDNICDNCATTIETNIKTPYIPVVEVVNQLFNCVVLRLVGGQPRRKRT